MRSRADLVLGQLAHLPTVWSNGLAGLVLAGGALLDARTLPLLLALSLFYGGGLVLNDGVDREREAALGQRQPINPAQMQSARAKAAGFAMMAAAILLLLLVGLLPPGGTGPWPAVGGLALALAVVIDRFWHQALPLSPPLVALCRPLAYLTAGLVVTSALPTPLLLAAGAVCCHVIGLTYLAKQPTLERVDTLWPIALLALPAIYGGIVAFGTLTGVVAWLALLVCLGSALRFAHRRRPGDMGRAVAILIAGIALLDALLVAGAGRDAVAWLVLLGFPLTLALQRLVPAA